MPTGAVSITGTAAQGQTLTADTTYLVDLDGLGEFSYQWKADGVNIAGATSQTYTLIQGDVDKSISVLVSYIDGGNTSESFLSDSTNAVINTNDVPTGLPVISGILAAGRELIVDTSSLSDADGLGTFSYQWIADGTDISGANSEIYTLTEEEIGKTIKVKVSYIDGQQTPEFIESSSTSAVAITNAKPVGGVSIEGTAAQGETLSADIRLLMDADGINYDSLSYQWKVYFADLYENILNANSSEYTVTQSEVGKQIAVDVSYTDGAGADELVVSDPTEVVANVNDTPTGNITIDGVTTQGQTLTANATDLADLDGLGTLSYQWKANGVNINGARSKNYILKQDEVGKAISVEVSYTDGGKATESVLSSETAPVVNINDDPTGLVSVVGIAAQGQTLTAITSTLVDPDGLGEFSYQWKADGSNISGATSSTYTLTQVEVGKEVSVVVTYTDGGNKTETVTSKATRAIENTDNAPTGGVSITGTPTEGETLTANTSTLNDPDTLGTLSYQWLADSIEINGATSQTYILSQDEVGKSISVRVSYTDGDGVDELVKSTSTSPVVNVNDSPSGLPTIIGLVARGRTLFVDTSTVTDADSPDGLGILSYQWKSDDIDIPGANNDSYELTANEIGKTISVNVSYTDGGGIFESVTSNSTGKVVDTANKPPTGNVTIDGITTQGQTLTAITDTLTDPDSPNVPNQLGTLSYQWKADGINISGANSLTYTLTQGEVGKRISVSVSYQDAAGVDELAFSAPSEVISNINDTPTGNVTIDGVITQGETITANTTNLNDPDGLGSFSYQWKANGTNITGANTKTYTLKQDEVGKAISVEVAYTDQGGAVESVLSGNTTLVANAQTAPTGSLSIFGALIQGSRLTADISLLEDADGIDLNTISYQWKADGTNINGATSSNYILTQNEVAKKISIEASYNDLDGKRETFSSSPSKVVENLNDKPTGIVLIDGQALLGQTLTANTTNLVDLDGLGAFSYQWKANGIDISGATSSTYTLQAAEVGKRVSVDVSYTDNLSSAEIVQSIATSTVESKNLAPTGSVVITGSRRQGRTLTADTSLLEDINGLGEFSYQWKANNEKISGATSSTYTLTQSEVGKNITVTVSYIDGGNSYEEISSVSTGAVANINDNPTGFVAIQGKVATGRTLVAETSSIKDLDGLGSLSYQWKADDVNISGATSRTYLLTNSDVNKSISVEVSYTDGGGASESLVSSSTESVIKSTNNPPTGNVTIDGLTTQGQTLTANTSTLADPDGLGSFSYQWSADGVNISGATSATYTLTQAEVGKAIFAVVSYTDDLGENESISSNPTNIVSNINDSPTGGVSIDGTASQGQTLTANTTNLVDLDGLGPLSYQWKADGTNIIGATTSSYTLNQTEVGKTISVTVSYTDAQGKFESVVSTVTSAVANTDDPHTGSLEVSGYLIDGQTLSISNTIEDLDGKNNEIYAWERSSDGGKTWLAIDGESNQNYTLTQGDKGSILRAKFTYQEDGTDGSIRSIYSEATPRVLSALNEGRTIQYTIEDALATLQWEFSPDGSTSGFSPIAGENSSTLKTEPTWGGGRVRLVVNGDPLDSLLINAIDDGTASLPTIQATRNSVAGSSTLSTTLPLDDPDGIDTKKEVQYQWQRFVGGQWLDIADAISSQYKTAESDANQKIRAKISYFDGQGYEYNDTNSSANPSLISAPVTILPPEADPPTGSFYDIADDNILSGSEFSDSVLLQGVRGDVDTVVSVSFGGQIRKATNDGLNWSYEIKGGDLEFLRNGANQISTVFSKPDQSYVSTFSKSLFLTDDVIIVQSNPNSAADPSQSDGIKQEVKQAAALALSALTVEIGKPNVAVAPLGSSSDFLSGADAPSDSYGAFELPQEFRVSSVSTFSPQEDNSFSIPGQEGSIDAPDTSSFSSFTDPIGITIKDIEIGGTANFSFTLPKSVGDQLLALENLDEATYLKFNRAENKFLDYRVDGDGKYSENGTKKYEYVRTGDFVVLNIFDLTDGSDWDRDAIKNGIIVDPFFIGRTIPQVVEEAGAASGGGGAFVPVGVVGGADGSTSAPISFSQSFTLPSSDQNFVYSGEESVEIIANESDNRIEASTGSDRIAVGKGNDIVIAGGGNDEVFAGQGSDDVGGNAGFDTIRGGQGFDTIGGGKGADRISAGLGADLVYGGAGHDRIEGDAGHDALEGGRGMDTLIGGAGSDHIQGVHSVNGRGINERDRLEGGDLSDTFYLGDEYGAYYLDIGDGMVSFAHIVDFDAEDKLALANKEGVRVIRSTTVAGVEGSGVSIFMGDDLVAFIQGDAAAINSIDLDDYSKVVNRRFSDLAPSR